MEDEDEDIYAPDEAVEDTTETRGSRVKDESVDEEEEYEVDESDSVNLIL